MSVHCSHVAGKFWVLTRLAIHCKHGIKNVTIATRGSLLSLTERCGDKLGIRSVVLLSELLDEIHKVELVTCVVTWVSHVLVTLPPEKSCDLILCRTSRIVCGK